MKRKENSGRQQKERNQGRRELRVGAHRALSPSPAQWGFVLGLLTKAGMSVESCKEDFVISCESKTHKSNNRLSFNA